MKNLANVLANTFTTILGTFTLSAIIYTWCYTIQLYAL